MASTQSSVGFGATTKWNDPVRFQRKGGAEQSAALTIGEFLKQSCDQMAMGLVPGATLTAPIASLASATRQRMTRHWKP